MKQDKEVKAQRKSERKAGKLNAETMIELSSRILYLEGQLDSEIWSGKNSEDKIKSLEESLKMATTKQTEAAFQAAQANIAEGKARTDLKEVREKLTAVIDERLTLRGKVVDLQAEIIAKSEQFLKADADARRMYQMAYKLEGELSIAKNGIGLWEKESAQWKNAHEHAHGLYVKEMKLKEKARREFRKFKKEVGA